MFLVMCFKKEHPIEVLGKEVPVPLSWHDKMIGVCPVFENKESALEYANGRFQVLELAMKESE